MEGIVFKRILLPIVKYYIYENPEAKALGGQYDRE